MTKFNTIFKKALKEYILNLDITSVPVDIECLARSHGVHSIESRKMKIEGYLGLSTQNKLVIRYKSGTNKERTRFTIAHEIGHIIISTILGEKIEKPVARGSIVRNHAEERIANRIAANLLMPEFLLAHDLYHLKTKWSSLHLLAKRYSVSITALILRLTELESIFAINATLDLSTTTTKNSIQKLNFSDNHKVLFVEQPEKGLIRLVKNYQCSENLIWKIEIDDIVQDLICDCRFYKNSEGVEKAQIIGWKKL